MKFRYETGTFGHQLIDEQGRIVATIPDESPLFATDGSFSVEALYEIRRLAFMAIDSATMPGQCLCEHEAHFEHRQCLTAGAHNGHVYGANCAAISHVATTYGTFPMCMDCREHLPEQFRKEA